SQIKKNNTRIQRGHPSLTLHAAFNRPSGLPKTVWGESWLSHLDAASTCPSPDGFEGGTANNCEGRKVPMVDVDSTLVETPQVLARHSLDLGNLLQRCRRTETLRLLGDDQFAL
ncbi:hypothetical protein MRX96_033478, partial [Rhipicephalus microplus]